jgi:hypothetical protein
MDMEEQCCPKFYPKPWDPSAGSGQEGKVVEWKNKKFIKDKVLTFFYIPINFGAVISRLMKKAEEANVKSEDGMCLSDHTSKWKMDIYVAVNKEVAGVENVTMSGKFLSKVYEGNFKDTGIWCQDFEEYAKSKKVKIEKMYMWYTTCPKCAKKYGKNYVVIIGKIN